LNKNLIWLIVLFVLMATNLRAGELSVTGYVDRTTIGQNEQLRFTIEVSGSDAGKIAQPELPEISGFRNIGSSTSSSSSFSIVNGKMTSSVTRSYVYTLVPEAAGTFLIPPVSIQFEDKTLVTDPIRITVTEGTTQPPPQTGRQRGSEPEPDENQISDNLFLRAELSKTNVVRGEPVILNYRLYSRYDLANLSYVNEPNFVGFWKDDIFFANRMNFSRTTYQGMSFNVMTLRRVVLYPNQSGTLTVPPLEINTDIIIRPRTFFDFDRTRKVNLASQPVSVTVSELPAAGKPESFTGAVGSFRLTSRISESELTAGDTFTYTVEISGNGNFKHFDPPSFPALPVLRQIDPEVVIETQPEGNLIKGEKTIRYPVIAREEGEHTIPPLVFSYYDPQTKTYRTLETPSVKLSVKPSEFVPLPHTVAQQDVVAEGTDIYYIYRSTELDSISFIHQTRWYWLLWLLVILTLPAALYYRLEQNKLAGDVNYIRQKQAGRILRKYLHKAAEAAKNGDNEFYSFVSTGLQNYLTDKLKISRGSTTDKILAEMQKSKFSPEIIEKVRSIVNRSLEARFMPGGYDPGKVARDYEDVKDLVSRISR